MRINSTNVNFWNNGGANLFNMSNNRQNNNVNNNMGFLLGTNNANTSQNTRANLLEVRQASDTMRSAVDTIRRGGSFGGLTSAVSEDSDIVRINSVNANSMRVSNVRDMSVEVTQLATAQRNEGTGLARTANAVESGFNAGNNSLSITIGNSQHDFNFNVSSTETNQQAQQRLANMINERGIGVTATVSTNQQTGESTLTLASSETGVRANGEANFTVSGNAASTLGVENITTQAQNAEFRVNRNGITGHLQTSRSNDVNIGAGISATLRAEGTADITPARDNLGQINAFRSLVNAFNDMISAASSGASGNRLERDISSMLRTHGNALENIGISINSSGWMTIDENRMREAAESGGLERFANNGFTGRLERTAAEMGRNPGRFVNDTSASNTRQNNSTNWINQMNRLNTTGMLFNTFI
jgi:hypothetical protein